MHGEIIAIGDELTSGRVLNTTSGLAARRLFAAGHEVRAMSIIGDDPELIGVTLKAALARSRFIIVTGGLGATSDDLTNQAVATALDRPTVLNREMLAGIFGDQKNSGDAMLEKIAWLPTGSEVLKPRGGMAGHRLEHAGVPIFFLPGVPHEMEELLEDCVLPELAARAAGGPGLVHHELYRVFGLGETEINQRCLALAAKIPGLAIGYYPVHPEIHVSLTLQGADREADFRIADTLLRQALAPYLFASGDQTLPTVVGALLTANNQTLTVAESCTGGRLAANLTGVAGSSAYFLGGVVAYSNELKTKYLGVAPELLQEQGAVSRATARAMARGILTRTNAAIGVSITGIAGPGGGSTEKPVGTVCFGLATAASTLDFQFRFPGVRWQVQAAAAHQALELVRRHLLDILPEKE